MRGEFSHFIQGFGSSSGIKGLSNIFTSLSSRNFKIYFFGQIVSLCGTWIQQVALSWMTYEITGSLMLLVVVALVNQLPSLIVTPFAGAYCDRVDRYKVLFGTQSLFMIQALVLAFLVLSGYITERSDAWILILLSAFSGIISAIDAPFRQSFYSKLVPRHLMSNAIALNSMSLNLARFIGPTIGGVLSATIGEGYCFLINGISYIAVLLSLLSLRLEPFKSSKHEESILSTIKEGYLYIKESRAIRTVLIYTAVISFIGLPIMTVLPALIKDVYGGDGALYGYVNSAAGAGSVVAALYLASMKNIKSLGKMLTGMAMIMGVSIISISILTNPLLVCISAFPLGFAMIGSLATSNILLQTIVDDSKRGRVMSFFTMALAGMFSLGGLFYVPFVEIFSLPNFLSFVGFFIFVFGVCYEYYRRTLAEL